MFLNLCVILFTGGSVSRGVLHPVGLHPREGGSASGGWGGWADYPIGYYGIWLMSGRYASYGYAFLFLFI